jgi:hypothetical protein
MLATLTPEAREWLNILASWLSAAATLAAVSSPCGLLGKIVAPPFSAGGYRCPEPAQCKRCV